MSDPTVTPPAPDRSGLSRRRFLGGVGASAAALTAGSVLGTASPAAAYYMKWGDRRTRIRRWPVTSST